MLFSFHLRSLGPPLVLSTGLLACTDGIEVTVENASGQPVSELVAEVEPTRMDFGDLAPGQKKTRAFVPTQDSSLALQFATPDGKRLRRAVSSYFTHGYCGEVQVVIGPDLEPSMHQDLSVGPRWLDPILEFFQK